MLRLSADCSFIRCMTEESVVPVNSCYEHACMAAALYSFIFFEGNSSGYRPDDQQ
jgi:hypothetical protein